MLDGYHLPRKDAIMSEKILIIDDDLDTLRLVGLMLQRQGYQISAATNGQQGLEKAFEEDPDLILLDVMMPDMDGYEVTRRLRQNPSTLQTPILMFTAKTQLDDKVIGFEVGANDYLTKPTHPSELQARVKAIDSFFKENGMRPEMVADIVLDAIRNDVFYVLTHPELLDRVEQRFRAILDGTNPPPPTTALNLGGQSS